MNPANPMAPPPPRHASFLDAIRGPIMLIALGGLLVADQQDRIGIERTWPALLILFGLLKLASFAGERNS